MSTETQTKWRKLGDLVIMRADARVFLLMGKGEGGAFVFREGGGGRVVLCYDRQGPGR